MAETIGSTKCAVLVVICSIVLNVLAVHVYLHVRSEYSWTADAVEEAEEVASITCSDHGRAFLDGLLADDGEPVCECNDCYQGPDCSQLIQDCLVDTESGDPMFLEPFWVKHAASSAVVVPGWHRMSYAFDDGSLISKELEKQIRKLHEVVGNAITKDRYIIFGAGATQLLNAAVHALSADDDAIPSKVLASAPYYPIYKEQTEFFDSNDYEFSGEAESWKDKIDSLREYIELVTSPSNPEGQLKKAVLKGHTVETVHDFAYYWPHYTAIPSPADEELMIFTLSKLTGHGGSRFGWAILKDEDVYQKMSTYLSLSTYGIPRETQLRVLKLLKVLVQDNGREMFGFGFQTLSKRWQAVSNVLSKSKRFSIQQLDHQYCSFYKKIREPSPAFVWLKCEREEEKNCSEVMKTANIFGREGRQFGANNSFVRLSLILLEDGFDLLLLRLKALVSEEGKIEPIMNLNGQEI